MDTRLKVLLLVLIFKCDAAFADATPVKNKGQIDFMDKTSKALQFDSCGIIYKNYQTNRLDTFFHCEGAECIAVVDKNSIRLSRHIPDHFKVIFYYGDKILSSPTLNRTGLNSYHQLLITDTGVKDVTPIFKTRYSNYFIALSTTILLELFVSFIYFWRYKIQFKKLPYIAYLNLLTHPVLWLVSANLTGFAFGNLIGEPLVAIIEGLLLFQLMKPNLTMGQSLWLSFLMNIVSFVLGGFVYFIATL